MNYHKYEFSDNIAIKESDEIKRSREHVFISYAFNDAYTAIMKSAGEAFAAGLDEVAFYLRSEAEKIRERANEHWGD